MMRSRHRDVGYPTINWGLAAAACTPITAGFASDPPFPKTWPDSQTGPAPLRQPTMSSRIVNWCIAVLLAATLTAGISAAVHTSVTRQSGPTSYEQTDPAVGNLIARPRPHLCDINGC